MGVLCRFLICPIKSKADYKDSKNQKERKKQFNGWISNGSRMIAHLEVKIGVFRKKSICPFLGEPNLHIAKADSLEIPQKHLSARFVVFPHRRRSKEVDVRKSMGVGPRWSALRDDGHAFEFP